MDVARIRQLKRIQAVGYSQAATEREDSSCGFIRVWGLGPSISLLNITEAALQHEDMSQEEGNSTSQSWQGSEMNVAAQRSAVQYRTSGVFKAACADDQRPPEGQRPAERITTGQMH
ncbi:uncharacterized protein V6R79_024754 [Siganus canaliculatus]